MCKLKKFCIMFIAVLVVVMLLLSAGCNNDKPVEGKSPESTADIPSGTNNPEDDIVVPEGGTVDLSVGPYDSLNPLTTSNEDIRIYTGLIYESLIKIDALMEPHPNVFLSWVSDSEYKIWEFTMREDIVFHDGSRADAEDVKVLLDYIIKNGGNYSENVRNISGCFVKDDYTVQLILKEPDALVPSKMAIPFLSQETLSGDNAENKPVGAGMYKFVSKKDGVILLEKNNEFFDNGRIPKIDKVKITEYKSEYEKYGSSFDIGFFYGSRPSSYIFDEKTRIYDFTGQTCNYIALNCKPTYTLEQVDENDPENITYTDIHNAFEDSRVRKAVSLLIDRNDICNISIAGKGTPCLYTAYSGISYWKGKYSVGKTDAETAYRLLKEAGYSRNDADGFWYYKDGTVLIIEAISPDSNFEMRSSMRGIKNMLEQHGIAVNIQELSDEEFSAKFDKKLYMMVPVQVELGAWVDLTKVYSTKGEYNYSFYSNPVIDGYLEQIRVLDEKGVISAGYNSIEDVLSEDCPVVALYISYDAVAVRDSLVGVKRESFYSWDPLAMFYTWGIDESAS